VVQFNIAPYIGSPPMKLSSTLMGHELELIYVYVTQRNRSYMLTYLVNLISKETPILKLMGL